MGTRTSPFDTGSDSDTFEEGRIRPLFTIEDLDSDEDVLKWVNETYVVELKRILPYRELAMKNVALYKNKQWFPAAGDSRGGFANTSTAGLGIDTSTRPAKIVVNHLFDLVNQRVARVLRAPAGVEVEPAQAEYSDRLAAKVTGMWMKFLFYKNGVDTIRAKATKAALTMGEAYCWVRWNPNLGEVAPDWRAEASVAKEQNRPPRLPLTDDDGQQITGQDGEPLWIEKPPKIGEVEFFYCSPLNTIPQFTGDFDRSQYFFYEEYQDIDELKALYPNSADDIESDKYEDDSPVSKWRSMSGTFNGPQQGKVLVRYFRHKPNDFLATGRWIVSTSTAILENKPLDPAEEGLHLIRITDTDNSDEQRGASFFTQGKSINAGINDMTSMGMRNTKMLSHPKWIYPKGSLVRKDALGNDITEVAFSGPIAPHVYTPPPMNSENMAMKADLKNDLQQILGASPAERGQIPANIRSATALQAMYEQDDMRSSEQNLKQGKFVREIAEAAINLASVYYDKADERLIPVVGRNNKFLIKKFDPENLRRGFTVKVANDNGLPSSKAVRFDMAMQLTKEMPDYMTEQRLAQFLEWGDPDEVLDAATKALRCAQAENEAMLADSESIEPASYEDHITHWTEHVKELQDYNFKSAVPADIQNNFVAHIMATEMFLIDACKKSPSYAMEVVKIPAFPLFYAPSAEDRMLLDSARTGNPLSLEQTQLLYDTGVAAMAAAKEAGGIPGGAAPPAGGFNPETNGVNGTAAKGPPNASVMQPSDRASVMSAPDTPPANSPPASTQPPA